jgi:hypothetical protein
MVFGKRGPREPENPPSDRDETYNRQPPHIRRLIDAMTAIFDDASSLAGAIRRGDALPPTAGSDIHFLPIRCRDSEKLFEHLNDKGETLYTTYHFTKDFKTIDAQAQVKLHVLYSRIYTANILVNSRKGTLSDQETRTLKSVLDEILAKSAYYINFFRGTSSARRFC